MSTKSKDEIRQAVREVYRKIASPEKIGSETNPDGSCCGVSDISAKTSSTST